MKYTSVSEKLKQQFGTKVYRLSLSTGCTCPNRDGTKGYGGCTFCSEGGSGEFAAHVLPVSQQIEQAKLLVDRKFPKQIRPQDRKYIAYFQSFSNTYGDIPHLRKMFLEAISREEIVILDIATRPDCINEECLDMLKELNAIKPVWVELGLQTMHEETAEAFHRGYRTAEFEECFWKLKEAGIEVIVHLILGLPLETEEMMLESVRYVNGLKPDGLKLHLLQILKGTAMAEQFRQRPWPVMSLEEYCSLIVKCLRCLSQDIVIHRLTGDGPKILLIEPAWCADKKHVLNTLNRMISQAERTEL